MSDGEFGYARFVDGPWSGQTERLKLPLPPYLLVPITSGRTRTWLPEHTEVVGAASYQLHEMRSGPTYVLISEKY